MVIFNKNISAIQHEKHAFSVPQNQKMLTWTSVKPAWLSCTLLLFLDHRYTEFLRGCNNSGGSVIFSDFMAL